MIVFLLRIDSADDIFAKMWTFLPFPSFSPLLPVPSSFFVPPSFPFTSVK